MMAKTNHLRGLVVLAALTLAAGLLVAVVAGKPAQASFPGANGLIAFESDRHSPTDPNTGRLIPNYEIYTMKAKDEENNETDAPEPDGNGDKLTRLTTTDANIRDRYPSWSPDGKKIAFMNRQGEHEQQDIYVMDAKDKVSNETGEPPPDGNGDNLIQLTNNYPFEDYYPSWSPDGTKIAFGSVRDDENGDIYVMDAKDEVNNETRAPEPDGNGDNVVRLTNNPANDHRPKWSPDGKHIAFYSNRKGDDTPNNPEDDNPEGDFEIYVMKPEPESATNVPINLTNNAVLDGDPDWSPDGSKIAFESLRDGNYEIYVMNAGGLLDENGNETKTPSRLTNNSVFDARPAWSPDGTKIAFTRQLGILDPTAPLKTQNYEIYVMDANGSNPTRLTNSPLDDDFASWQPHSKASK